jgi:serine O-acetyltransferase
MGRSVFIQSPGVKNQRAPLSAVQPDWAREKSERWWDPGRRLLACIRRYQYWRGRWGLIGRAISKWHVATHRLWSVITGADIPLNTVIGGGFMLPHPNGVVINPGTAIGVNCIVFQQVTLGTRVGAGSPVIGGDVEIGAGAKVLGRVRIGDHARVGANAVVLNDVPENAVAVGVPAVIVGLRDN